MMGGASCRKNEHGEDSPDTAPRSNPSPAERAASCHANGLLTSAHYKSRSSPRRTAHHAQPQYTLPHDRIRDGLRRGRNRPSRVAPPVRLLVRRPGRPRAAAARDRRSRGDRTSVVSGKSVSVRVVLGGRRIIKKKNT